MDNRFERFFIRNDETGLIEVWSCPCAIGDGHYAVGVDYIINEGFYRHGFEKTDKANEFLEEVKRHYANKCHRVPKLSVVKVVLNLEILNV